MKKHILLVLILTIAISLNTIAQLVNCNPDPQGDPWWAGGDIALTEAEWAMIPQLTLTTESAATTLLDVVDNSQLQYFPPIFQQIGGSCAQAAGIGYIFTYEINRERDVAANTNTNLYPHMHTYNFLHKNNKGSNTIDGWRIAQENGIPNEVVYDNPYVEGDPEVLLFWMSGYEKYYSAMNNRISGYWSIEFDISGNNFDLVQHWINDHNAGKTTGGIAKLSTVLVEIIDYGTYEPGLPQAGKKFVKQWGTDPGSKHALTIVGYDDEVKYDWNNDGQYTNTDDINDDGEVNMWDWEIGAVKLANSWGNKWPTQFDEGFIYMPYKLFGTTGGPDFKVLVCEAEESHETEIVFKSELFHGDRELFGFGVTYGIDANSNPVGVGENAGSFWQQGGPEPINGINNNPLEFAFDFGYFYGDEDFGQVYATIFNTSSTNYA